jgi:hypothetical protein
MIYNTRSNTLWHSSSSRPFLFTRETITGDKIDLQIAESGPLRVSLVLSAPMIESGGSYCRQHISLTAWSPHLSFDTTVEWRKNGTKKAVKVGKECVFCPGSTLPSIFEHLRCVL